MNQENADMARSRKGGAGTGARPFLDMGGTPPQPEDGKAKKTQAANFLAETAEEDREDARTQHANKGLRAAKDNIGVMAKAVAHALASDSEAIKLGCLEEIADLGSAVRDGCRAAMRDAKKETRNLQPATGE